MTAACAFLLTYMLMEYYLASIINQNSILFKKNFISPWANCSRVRLVRKICYPDIEDIILKRTINPFHSLGDEFSHVFAFLQRFSGTSLVRVPWTVT